MRSADSPRSQLFASMYGEAVGKRCFELRGMIVKPLVLFCWLAPCTACSLPSAKQAGNKKQYNGIEAVGGRRLRASWCGQASGLVL